MEIVGRFRGAVNARIAAAYATAEIRCSAVREHAMSHENTTERQQAGHQIAPVVSQLEAAHSILIKIAAQMVRGDGLPSEHIEDWPVAGSTSRKLKRAIVTRVGESRTQAIRWSGEMMKVVKMLSEISG